MPYQATRRIKLGDKHFAAGDEIPESLRRDWAVLVRRGYVVKLGGGKSRKDDGQVKALEAERDELVARVAQLEKERAEAGQPDASGDGGGEAGPDLNAMKRAELDAIAAELGIEEPGSLPNKPAVIEAIQANQAQAG